MELEMADTKQDIDLLDLFSHGVDERIYVTGDDNVKYGMSLFNDNVINRGSCTASPVSPELVEISNVLLNTCKTDADWDHIRGLQYERLKDYLSLTLNDDFQIVYGPSGTDLMYLPMIFSKVISPEKPILNVVTCLEEIGSGGRLAAQGQYHAEYNQFNEPIPKGEFIYPDLDMETIFLKARTEEGYIHDPEQDIIDQIAKHPDHSIIVNLVYGSKSGIEDNLSIIDKVKANNVIWNVDFCQFRHDREVITYLLNRNAMVMVTGSKFYQAPPFCGAMLIPNKLTGQLSRNSNLEIINHFDKVFSTLDFPRIIRKQIQLPHQTNISNILRWEGALDEINRYNEYDQDFAQEKMVAWNTAVNSFLEEHSEFFEIMPNAEMTNNTIISFRVKYNGVYMGHDELIAYHQFLVNQNYDEHGWNRIFVGQPVAYMDKSFLRLAIGSRSVRKFMDRDEKEFDDDAKIIDIMIEQLKAFHEHKQ